MKIEFKVVKLKLKIKNVNSFMSRLDYNIKTTHLKIIMHRTLKLNVTRS